MNWGIRGSVLAAGAAALLSTQAVYAAPPAPQKAGVDPLVSLSVLSAPQPSAALVASAAAVQSDDGQPKSTGEVERIVADAMNAGGQEQVIEDLLASLPTKAIHAALESMSDHGSGAWSSLAANFAMNHGISGEMLALHHDAAPVT